MPAPSAPNDEVNAARKARASRSSPDWSRRPSASGSHAGALMLGPSSWKTRFWPMFKRRRRTVAVLVGDRRRQRDQVVRRQRRRLVRIVRSGAPPHGSGPASHCRRASTVTVNTSSRCWSRCGLQRPRRSATRFTASFGRRVDQPRRARHDAQRIGDRAGAIRAKRRGERTRKARRRVRRQNGLVNRQRRARSPAR